MDDVRISAEEVDRFAARLPDGTQAAFRAAVSPPSPSALRRGMERVEEVAFVAGPPQAFLVLTTRWLYVVRLAGGFIDWEGRQRPLAARVDGADLVVGQEHRQQRFRAVAPPAAAKTLAGRLVEEPRARAHERLAEFNPLTAQW